MNASRGGCAVNKKGEASDVSGGPPYKIQFRLCFLVLSVDVVILVGILRYTILHLLDIRIDRFYSGCIFLSFSLAFLLFQLIYFLFIDDDQQVEARFSGCLYLPFSVYPGYRAAHQPLLNKVMPGQTF